MTAKTYIETRGFEQVRVSGGDFSELSTVVTHIMMNREVEGLTWHINGDAIVFEWAAGTKSVGGRDYFEVADEA